MKNTGTTQLLIVIILTIMFPFLGISQKISLSGNSNEFVVHQTDDQSFRFSNAVSSVSAQEINTKQGIFSQLRVHGYNHSNEAGAPMLPVLKKLIEVPYDAEFEIRFNNLSYETLNLSDFDINTLIFPAQPPVSKSDDVEKLPFVFKNEIYETNDWYGQELVRVIDLGEMRGVRMARLEIAPFMYNPVSGQLQAMISFDCEIQFKGANYLRTNAEKSRVYSPWFEASFRQLINHTLPGDYMDAGEALIDVAPITYIIVADRMFEDAIQTFIQWKTEKGFRVVEAYTDDPAVGSSTTSIKSYLKNFYQNPPEGFHPQSFVLIVGDVAQIPAFNGATGSHVTDLYYCEYTNDIFPECFYGRFSANNLIQLQPQIDKTIQYEKYTFPDASFLDEVVMIAGADASHQLTWGNGQINYGTQYYFNASHGITSHTYLQPEPSGGNYSVSIRQDISNGVAYANYSAHCSASGWANPSFTISNISALTNFHQYPLMVGNCCLSAKFEGTCFGEEILRAPLKGAVGYIGGSNNTYWDEDFWWGVGLENISANPTYNANHLGAYDRTFHDRSGITTNDWFVTQGQMVSAGNLAVSQSGSSRKNYYWEIYHLMGDPSLMVYFSQAPQISASFPAIMPLAAESFTINTEPYAYVAISKEGVLHGAALANATGVAEILLDPITEPGEADIVITGQNLKPYFGAVQVSTPNGPFITLQGISVDDAAGNGNGLPDYGESMFLDITLGNQGNETGENINLLLSVESDFVNIKQATASLGSIEPGQSIVLDNAFDISLTNNVPNGQVINFLVSASDGTQTWESNFSLIANAPVLQYTSFSISDPSGNNNGLLDPGETVTLSVSIANTGDASAINVLGQLESSSPHISILSDEPQLFGNINPDESSGASFEIYCSDGTPAGQNIDFTVALTAEKDITASGSFSLIAGQIPVLIVDLDGNKNSADAILESINGFGVDADFTETFPVQPELYSSIFLCLGIYSNNYKLNVTEGQVLANYLDSGGNLYIEGGDTWYYDNQTAVHSMFGINGVSDGSGDLGTVLGVDGTMTSGMTFSYSGENRWIDRLEAIDGGQLILKNQTPAYGCGVINQGTNYKTIGLSLEFGGLSEEKDMLMEQFLLFFDLLQAVNADFTADHTDIIIGESVQFINLSGGSPESYSWSFPGGQPAQSTQENPLVVYNTAGEYDVSLTVSSGGSSSSITKNNFIVVQAALNSQSISLSKGWNGISSYLIPENTNLYVLLDQYINNITIMQNMNGVFYPDLLINTLGDWNYQSGYLLKAENNFVMEINGTEPDVMQVPLKVGWNILPILSNCNVVLEDLIAPISNKITVMKDVAGTGVYWPGFGINTIGILQPGQAYFIHVSESVTITFDDCD